MGKLRNHLKGSQIMSSIDLSQFVFKEEYDFYHNQLFDIKNYNQSNTTTRYHHGINYHIRIIGDDCSKILVDLVGSSQMVNYEVYEIMCMRHFFFNQEP